MATYDETGISVDRYADVKARLVLLARSQWGQSINVEDDEILGQLFNLLSTVMSELNEIGQDNYDAHSVINATGAKLDHILALLFPEGRQEAAYSTAVLTCTMSKAGTIPAGSLARTAAGVVFATDDDLVFVGAGSDDVDATCTEYGPNQAAIGEIIEIVTPVNGWTAVTNAAAAVPGRLRETDAQYKARHTAAINTSGLDDVASIQTAVSEVSGVSNCLATDDTSAHTINVVVTGGSNADIAEAIAANRTAGIPTTGAVEVEVINATTGLTEIIKFDRSVDVSCYVIVNIAAGIDFPDDGETQIKDAIEDYFAGLGIGDDVIFTALYRPIYGVAGVTVTSMFLDFEEPCNGTANITIDTDELASITTAHITVNVA